MSKVLCHQNIYAFMHIPIQSGSDKILMKMNREYNSCEFRKVIDGFRYYEFNINNEITIATDIICGFCFENDDDHKESINIIDEYKFRIVNISQF